MLGPRAKFHVLARALLILVQINMKLDIKYLSMHISEFGDRPLTKGTKGRAMPEHEDSLSRRPNLRVRI